MGPARSSLEPENRCDPTGKFRGPRNRFTPRGETFVLCYLPAEEYEEIAWDHPLMLCTAFVHVEQSYQRLFLSYLYVEAIRFVECKPRKYAYLHQFYDRFSFYRSDHAVMTLCFLYYMNKRATFSVCGEGKECEKEGDECFFHVFIYKQRISMYLLIKMC